MYNLDLLNCVFDGFQRHFKILVCQSGWLLCGKGKHICFDFVPAKSCLFLSLEDIHKSDQKF